MSVQFVEERLCWETELSLMHEALAEASRRSGYPFRVTERPNWTAMHLVQEARKKSRVVDGKGPSGTIRRKLESRLEGVNERISAASKPVEFYLTEVDLETRIRYEIKPVDADLRWHPPVLGAVNIFVLENRIESVMRGKTAEIDYGPIRKNRVWLPQLFHIRGTIQIALVGAVVDTVPDDRGEIRLYEGVVLATSTGSLSVKRWVARSGLDQVDAVAVPKRVSDWWNLMRKLDG